MTISLSYLKFKIKEKLWGTRACNHIEIIDRKGGIVTF